MKFSEVRKAQNSQREGDDERKKKHENVKLKEEDVPELFYRFHSCCALLRRIAS